MRDPKKNRAAFIRTLPVTMTVAEVIAKGKAKGLEIKPSDVHAVRYYQRRAEKQGAKASAKSSKAKLRETGDEGMTDAARDRAFLRMDPAQQFTMLAIRIGTERSRSLLENIERGLETN